MEDELRAGLRESYGRKARERDPSPIGPWKAEERRRFLALLQDEAGARCSSSAPVRGRTASSSGTTAST